MHTEQVWQKRRPYNVVYFRIVMSQYCWGSFLNRNPVSSNNTSVNKTENYWYIANDGSSGRIQIDELNFWGIACKVSHDGHFLRQVDSFIMTDNCRKQLVNNIFLWEKWTYLRYQVIVGYFSLKPCS